MDVKIKEVGLNFIYVSLYRSIESYNKKIPSLI